MNRSALANIGVRLEAPGAGGRRHGGDDGGRLTCFLARRTNRAKF